MMGRYDEDVCKNPFFSRILCEHPEYIEQIVACKGILCVPKYAIASNWSPSHNDFEDYILLPSSDVINNDDDILTLSKKILQIVDRKLVTKSGFTISKQITVLFTETFHTDRGGSYQVFCLDDLFNTSEGIYSVTPGSENPARNTSPASYKECLELLWSHSGGHKTRESVDKVLATFAVTYDRLEGETLRSIMDAASTHFTKAMQLILKDSVMRRTVQQNPYYMDNIKMAVETYVMNSVHKHLFPVITATVAGQDAEINKINRNLVDLRSSDLGIRKIFCQNIPSAKKELNSLNLYNTPMEKLYCLQRAVAALTRQPKSASKENTKDSVTLMSTDDLLPILIFLIVKSEIPNWNANLVYMQHFHFSKSSDDDEFGFYLASVEAALTHIESGDIKNEVKPLKRDRWNSIFVTDPGDNSMASKPRSLSRQLSHSAMEDFFRLVQEGNLVRVQEILEQPHKRSEEIHRKLCHPLCSCVECDKLLSHFRSNSDLVTAYSRDSRGNTAMHIAAYYGQESLIDLLIQNNALVNTTDYLGLTPLHLACQRGVQNVILPLLHFGADVMATDSEGNTPLHFCCANGHEDCVRTLLFHEASLKKLEVNLANELGDTALHLAAKWGYETIVKILMEKGADATLCNKRKQTPVSLAQNVRVQRWLKLAVENPNFQTSGAQQPDSVAAITDLDVITNTTQNFIYSEQHEEKFSLYERDTLHHVQTSSLEAATEHEQKKEEEFFKAIIEGDAEQVKCYLGIQSEVDYGEDDDSPTSPSSVPVGDMCHPLCHCHRCLLIQKTIHKTGNGVNVNLKTLSGWYPIHMAVIHSHSHIVSVLISCNADVTVQNHQGLTPLHLACCVRSVLITDLLLKAGARLNIREINGNTPLLFAVCNGFVDGVQVLIKAGAVLNSRNHKGNTALHEALKRDDTQISSMLLRAGADPRIKNMHEKLPIDETDVSCLSERISRIAGPNDPSTQDILREACCRLEEVEADTRNNNSTLSKQDMKGCEGQITIQELFAAFEEKDLHRLQILASSIRSFDHKSGLKSTKTKDRSAPYLDATGEK